MHYPYYNDNYSRQYYNPYYYNWLTGRDVGNCTGGSCEVPIPILQKEIDRGRRGHCYKAFWAGETHTFQLMNVTPEGMVEILENNMPNQIFHKDIIGLQYQGMTCPSPTVTGNPPNCHTVFIPGRGLVTICF